MNRLFASVIALALLPSAPAFAQSILQSHAEHAGTSGKTPTKAYRPLVQDSCRPASNHHQTGKIPLTPQVAASDRGCSTELAARDTGDRKE